MRIPSGTTDQFIYFVAVDATDFVTRETGLAGFTVYRSRNGGAAAAMTTPTINETDSTNMPGVYELLLDEDMTIDSGNDSEEMAFHITVAGMAPVTRTIELYRPKITIGNTLGVAADGDISGNVDGSVNSVATQVDADVTAISGDTTAANNLESDYDGTGYNKSTSTIGTCTANTDMRGTDNSLLASSAPANFGDLAITVTTGQVTVGTNNDKTGYTVSTNNDKTGYSVDTVNDKTGYSVDTVNDKSGYTISGTLTTLDALDSAQDAQHAQTQSDIAALNDISVSDILTTQMTESYAADGVAPTIAQAIFLIQQTVGDFSITGTTVTVREINGTTTAATYLLDDDTAPTSRTRAS